MEGCLAAYREIEGEVGEGLVLAAGVEARVQLGVGVDHVELGAGDVLAQVQVLQLVVELQVELVAVVRPRPELEVTRLLVKREVAHVDLTRRLVDGRRDPAHVAVTVHRQQLLVLLLLHVRAASTRGWGIRRGPL